MRLIFYWGIIYLFHDETTKAMTHEDYRVGVGGAPQCGEASEEGFAKIIESC